MKTINRLLGRAMLILAFFTLICTGGVMGHESYSGNENFSITADNSANSTGWNLKYSASENAFKITMSENNGDKEFTVRSKFFEIAYVLNKNGFGARMIRPGKSLVPAQIIEQIINKDALKQQKVISDASISNETALNLIASYLPDLINNNYKHLLQ